ncbi:MAG: hypothetical protein IKX54_05080 [Lachnospiraceae bacterium]|nr:hypothetical protein [Lachnospiraceae bacterium]
MERERFRISAIDYSESEKTLAKMRKALIIYLCFEVILLLMLNMATLYQQYEITFMIKIDAFLEEHDFFLIVLTVIPSCAAFLYFVYMLQLHVFEKGLLVAGVVGMISQYVLHSNVSQSSGAWSVTTASLVGVFSGLIFRKIYCDSMKKATSYLSETGEMSDARESWEKFWTATIVIVVITIILSLVMKMVYEGAYEAMKNAQYGETLAARKKYYLAMVLMVNVSVVSDLVLRVFEIGCLKKTRNYAYGRMLETEIRAKDKGNETVSTDQ